MVKRLVIVPGDVRRQATIALGTIPVNSYRKTLADEVAKDHLQADDAVRIYRDMVLIREF